MPEEDVERLVDDILTRCVPGYRRPALRKKKMKRTAASIADGFVPPAKDVEPDAAS